MVNGKTESNTEGFISSDNSVAYKFSCTLFIICGIYGSYRKA